MVLQVRSLIDASTGQPFTAVLDVGGVIPPVPYTNAKNEPMPAPVPLAGGVDTLIHSFLFAGSPGMRIVLFMVARCDRAALSTSTMLRYRLKMDGVQLGAEGAIDVPYNTPTGLTAADAEGTIFAVAPLTDSLPHSFEGWIESVGGAATFDEGSLMVIR